MRNILACKVKLLLRFMPLLIFLCFGINVVNAQSPEIIAEKTKASTVLLELKDANDRSSQGSGFFVGNRLVATNYHVINGKKTGTAKLVSKNSFTQQKRHEIEGVVAIDKKHDLAIVKVSTLNARSLPLGNSDTVEIGEIVYAVGNPRGFEGTFSSGEISNILSNGTPRIQDEVLQFTAAISRGSSGGAVVNRQGEVIGIVSETRDDGQNLNFAIPVNTLKVLLNQVGPAMPFPDEVLSKGMKSPLAYPLILLNMSIVAFVVIWFLPTVNIDQWSTAVGVALGFGAIKTMFTAIVRSASFPVGLKSIWNHLQTFHALDCEDCIIDLNLCS